MFADTATYRGMRVAVKTVTRPTNFRMTRKHLVELKQARYMYLHVTDQISMILSVQKLQSCNFIVDIQIIHVNH